MGRSLALVIACLAGCYQAPSLASCKYRCGGANNDLCPSGYECNAGMCVLPGEGCTDDGGVIDARPNDGPDGDGMMIDAPVCANPVEVNWVSRSELRTGSNLSQLVVVDADGDGVRDIAVLDASTAIGVFLGNGDGTFGGRLESTIGSSTVRIAVGDFDRDGKRDDLVALNASSTDITILTSSGNGFYTGASFGIATPGNPVDIASPGDLDGDGDDDLVVLAGGTSPNLAVARHGTSADEWPFVIAQENGLANPTFLFVGPVDSDAPHDALVVQNSGQLALFPGLAGQVFGAAVNVPVQPNAVSVAAAQLRSTGLRTIVSANSSSNNVSVRHVTSPNSFQDGGDPTTGGNSRPVAVVLAQIAGSPLPDIVTANRMNNQFGVFVNDNGSFTNQETTGTLTNPVDIVAADFDGDLRLDVAVAHMNGAPSSVVVYLNQCNP